MHPNPIEGHPRSHASRDINHVFNASSNYAVTDPSHYNVSINFKPNHTVNESEHHASSNQYQLRLDINTKTNTSSDKACVEDYDPQSNAGHFNDANSGRIDAIPHSCHNRLACGNSCPYIEFDCTDP
ncbi:hypothetical protein BBJ29_004944 [Phytophthora kernoviae]|uniref:Uncharacterized protein n=1 Tax=Phytophthora kernoviae TaxID=325452 RepID=A0A3F2S0D8_9STRA|nr:hypothetical protein BBP00_00001318 [Phytophthora kernoviae]RLN70638.1 hypothetical protein BBJ29_004944 [Phytophthora kernoviae]